MIRQILSLKAWILLGLILQFLSAKAQTEPPQFITVDGRLYDSATPTEPLLDGSVQMRIQVLNPAKTCILYEEQQTVSTISSNGFFNVRVGSPTSGPDSLKRTALDAGNTMATVFQNQSAPIAGNSSGGMGCSYTPSQGETRYFRFIVTPSTTGVTSQLSPDMTVDSVPQALVAESVQGMLPDAFIQVSADVTQVKLESLLGTSYTTLTSLLGGTSTLYLRNTTNGTVIPSRPTDPAAPVAGQMWFDSTTSEFKYYDGTAVQTIGAGGGGDPTKLPLAGGTMTGAINMGSNDITSVGHITQSAQRTMRFGGYTGGQEGVLVGSLLAGQEGTTWYNTTTDKIMYWDGTAATELLTANSANGLVPNCAADQSLQMSAGPIYVWSCVATTDSTKLALAGGTMTGAINMGSNDLTSVGHVTLSAQRSLRLGRYTTAQQTTLVGTLIAGQEGTTWYNTTTNKMMYWDGTAAREVVEANMLTGLGDITEVNTNAGSGLSGGVTSGAASLQVEVDNVGLEINGSNDVQLRDGGVVTAKIADNAITSAKINNGEITNDDINATAAIAWSKIDKTGAVAGDVNAVARAGDTMTGQLVMGPRGVAAGDGGAVSFTELLANGTNTAMIRAPDALAANYVLTLPADDGTAGQVLQTDGSGVLSWTTVGAASIADDSLDFDKLSDTMNLDASTDFLADNAEVFSVTNTGTGDSFRVNDQSGDTTPFVIDASGYVGIGTASPTHLFETVSTSNLPNARFIATGVGNSIKYPLKLDVENTATNGGVGLGSGLMFNLENSANGFRQAATIIALQTDATSPTESSDLLFETRLSGTVSEKMRILSTGDVGIGTSAPGSKLDVAGAITSRPFGTATGETGQFVLRELAANGTNTATIRSPDALAANYVLTLPIDDGTAGQVLQTDGSGVLSWTTVGAASIADDSLDFDKLSDTMNLDASTTITADNAEVLSITNTGTGNSFVVNDQASDTTPFVVDASGNLGIGTSAPAAGIDVSNGVMIRSGNINSVGDFAIARNGSTRFTFWGGYTQLSGFMQNTSSGGINIGSGNSAVNPSYSFSSDNNTGMYSPVAQQLGFSTNSQERLRIDANGNIGVGTTTPGSRLDIAGAITSRPFGTATGETGQLLMRELAANGTNTATIRAPDALAANYVLTLPIDDGNAGQVLQTDGSGLLSWTTLGAASIADDSLDFDKLTDTMNLDASTSITADNAEVLSITNTGTGNSFVVNDESADATPFVINPSGLVGIGTTSPARTLDVSSNNTAWPDALIRIQNTAPTRFTQMEYQGTGITYTTGVGNAAEATWDVANKFYLYDLPNNAMRFVVTPTGNMGIGTTAPSTRLDVAGAITSRPLGTASGETGQLVLRELAANGTETATIRAPDALAANYVLTLPGDDGTAGQLLQTDGNGVLSWVSGGASLISDDALDFDKFSDSMSLDASTDIAVDNAEVLSVTNTGTGASFVVNDQASDASPFVIDASGNLGVGTSTPTTAININRNTTQAVPNLGSLLHLTQSNGVSSAITMDTYATNFYDSAYLSMRAARGTAASPTFLNHNDFLGVTQYMGWISANNYQVGAQISVSANQTWTGSVRGTRMDIDIASMGSTTIRNTMRILSNGISFYDPVDPTAYIFVNGSRTSTGWTTDGSLLQVRSGTLTDNSGAVGTVTNRVANSIGTPTLASSGAITVTNASTFYISGAPTAGANTTITNSSALRVASGNSLFGGSVGIGTTVPGTLLDVSGAITSRPFGVATGQTGQLILRELAANGTETATIRSPDALAANYVLTLPGDDGTAGQLLQTDGNGVLSWVSGGASLITDDSLDFDKLSDSLNLDASTSITADNAEVFSVVNTGTGVSFRVEDESSDPSPFVIDASGSLGLGTSTPTEKLSVENDNGDANLLTRAYENGIFSNTFFFQKARGTAAAPLILNPDDRFGVLQFMGYDGNSFEAGAGIQARLDGTAGDGDMPGRLDFFTTPDGSVTSLSRVSIVNSGAVGVGTTAPTTLLDVAGAITSRPFGTGAGEAGQLILRELTANGSNTATLRSPDVLAANYVLTLPVDDGNPGQVLQTDGNGVLSWVAPGASIAADSLNFTDFSDTLVLDATTDISATGTNSFSITNSGTGASFRVNDSTGDTSPFIINDMGFVGIGTNNPTRYFHLEPPAPAANTAGSNIFIKAQDSTGPASSTGGNLLFQTGAGAGGWSDGYVDFSVGDQYVSISQGTTNSYNPAVDSGHILYLSNGFAVDNNSALIQWRQVNGSGNFQYSYMGPVTVSGAGTYSPAFVFGHTSGNGVWAETMRINENGRLGIGTSTPGTLLDVAGAITSRPSGVATGQTGQIIMRELAAGGTESATIRAPDALAANYVLTLPVDDGTSGQVLQTDGSGLLSWVSPATAIATNSLDFDRLVDAMSLDASTDIAVDNAEVLSITNTGTGNSLVVNDAASDTSPFVIDATGNVGVGTTSPSYKFQVVGGNTRHQRNSDTDVSAPAYDNYRSRGTASAPTALLSGDHLFEIWSYGYDGAAYSSTGGVIMETDGNWSGTSRPSRMMFYTTDNGSTSDTLAMSIRGNGRVAIGNHVPQDLFHVSGGNVRVTRNNNDPSNGPVMRGQKSRGTFSAPTIVAPDDNLLELWGDGYNGTAYAQAAGIQVEAAGTWSGTSTPGRVLFFTTPDGTTGTSLERVRITEGGLVGIGTTLPGTILDVAGAITSRPLGTAAGETGQILFRELAANGTNTATIRAPDALAANYVLTLPGDDGAAGQVLSTDGNGVLSWVSASTAGGTFLAGNGSNTAPSLSFATDTNTGFFLRGADDLGVTVNGIDSASISNDTWAIYRKIQTNNCDVSNPCFSFTNDPNTGVFNPAADVVGISANGVERLRVNGSGHVGIGTTAPTRNLEVVAADASTELRIINTTSTATRAPKMSIRNYRNGQANGNPEIQLLNSGGTVTTTAAIASGNRLGMIAFDGVYDTVGGYGSGADFIGEADGAYTSTSTPGRLILRTTPTGATSPTERLRITSSGRVGIGTTAPQGLLDVQGGAAPASTAGLDIIMEAQDSTGPAGNIGGSFRFTTGAGGGGWGDGNFLVNLGNGGAVYDRSRNYTYTSTGAWYEPDVPTVELLNGSAANGNFTSLGMNARNTSGVNQRAYVGVTSNSSGNTPDVVIGQQTGGSSYQERIRINANGNVGIGTTNPTSTLTVNGGLARNIVTVTAATYTVAATDTHIIANRSGTITLTLPAAASFPGREISVRTIQAQTVISASSNVVPLAGGAAGTAILAATAGRWAMLVSDGTNWQIQMGN